MYKVVCILFIASVVDAKPEECLKGPENYYCLKPMEYVNYNFTTSVKNGSVKLTLEFSWKVKEDVLYDGFLYHLTEDDQHENDYEDKEGNYDFYDYDVAEKTCTDRLLKVNHLNISKSDKHDVCDRCSDVCGYSQFCWGGYSFLPKTNRSLRFDAKFGANYDFQIGTHANFTTSSMHNLNQKSTFCKDQLVVKEKNTMEKANKLCENQSLENAYYLVGPAFNVTISHPRLNPANNKVSLKATWMRPLDVAENSSITKYRVVMKNEDMKVHEMKYVRNDAEANTVSATLNNLPQNLSLVVYVRAYPEKKQGYLFEDAFEIPDMNACNISAMTPFCDGNASCKDLSSDKDKGAECRCYAGFDGNGIHPYYNGSGCYETCNHKHMKNHSCAENAICNMDQNNRTVLCHCIPPYKGDGYRRGSGCVNPPTKVILMMSFGLTAFVVILIAVITISCIRKRRRERLEYGMSQFETDEEGPGDIKFDGGENAVHVNYFEKWEKNPNDITLDSVLGRGNFGVVYKALLIESDGGNITVAAKEPSD